MRRTVDSFQNWRSWISLVALEFSIAPSQANSHPAGVAAVVAEMVPLNLASAVTKKKIGLLRHPASV